MAIFAPRPLKKFEKKVGNGRGEGAGGDLQPGLLPVGRDEVDDLLQRVDSELTVDLDEVDVRGLRGVHLVLELVDRTDEVAAGVRAALDGEALSNLRIDGREVDWVVERLRRRHEEAGTPGRVAAKVELGLRAVREAEGDVRPICLVDLLRVPDIVAENRAAA